MAVVNDYNVDYPLEFYNFFKELDCRFIQFAPIVERIGRHKEGTKLSSPEEQDAAIELAPFSVDSEKWGFPLRLVRRVAKRGCRQVLHPIIRFHLGELGRRTTRVCSLARHCGHAGVMEFNGDVYACDHFVFPEYKLGNIQTKTLTEMMYSPVQQKFGTDKEDKLPTQCKGMRISFRLPWRVPENRFLHTPNGEPGLNYLCKGYKKFFKHVAPYMDFMKKNY